MTIAFTAASLALGYIHYQMLKGERSVAGCPHRGRYKAQEREMKNTIQYGSESHVSHAGEYGYEEQFELPIDKQNDTLELVTICLAQPVNLDSVSL